MMNDSMVSRLFIILVDSIIFTCRVERLAIAIACPTLVKVICPVLASLSNLSRRTLDDGQYIPRSVISELL